MKNPNLTESEFTAHLGLDQQEGECIIFKSFEVHKSGQIFRDIPDG